MTNGKIEYLKLNQDRKNANIQFFYVICKV